jgi:hypothetical protein
MIQKIIELLAIDEFYGQSELIDIAKGKYKIQNTVIGMYKQKKRIKALKDGRK